MDVAERRQRKRESNIQTFSSAGSDRVMEQNERHVRRRPGARRMAGGA